jgi:hypothetical protein
MLMHCPFPVAYFIREGMAEVRIGEKRGTEFDNGPETLPRRSACDVGISHMTADHC